MAFTVISACWIAFLAYWLLASFRVKIAAEQQSAGSRLFHSVHIWAGAALLFFHPHALGLGRAWLTYTPSLGAAAAALAVAGLAVAIWARRTLGDNWSGAVTIKQDHELVQSGPYRWVRNPIYTGLLLMFAGTALAVGQVRGLVALALAGVGFGIKIRQEEAFMLRQFPETFAEYRRHAKAIVPFVI